MKITSYVSFLYCLCLMLASPTVQASEVHRGGLPAFGVSGQTRSLRKNQRIPAGQVATAALNGAG